MGWHDSRHDSFLNWDGIRSLKCIAPCGQEGRSERAYNFCGERTNLGLLRSSGFCMSGIGSSRGGGEKPESNPSGKPVSAARQDPAITKALARIAPSPNKSDNQTSGKLWSRKKRRRTSVVCL